MQPEPEKFEIYKIQHRRRAEGEWLKVDSPLKEVEQEEWSFSCWDTFGASFDPWKSYGVRKYPKISAHVHRLWSKTGLKGWTKLEYAEAALQRVIKDDNRGKYDSEHYGRKCQVLRHHFRIVKVIHYNDVVIVNF